MAAFIKHYFYTRLFVGHFTSINQKINVINVASILAVVCVLLGSAVTK